MLGIDELWDELSPTINAALGAETIVLQRGSRLYAGNNEAPATLELAAAAAAGATSIVLRASGGRLLSGSLLAGQRYTIAGATYTGGATTHIAAGGAGTVATSISPALTAAAAEGAVVTLAGGPRYTWTNALVLDVARRHAGGDPGAEVEMVVDLPTLSAPTTPEQGDRLERPKTGFAGRVDRVPPAIAGSWRVEVGPA